jgi:hypothetical protein
MIVKHGAIVDSINFEESRKSYVDNADRCSHNNERFWFCPNMSNEKIDDLLSKLGTVPAAKLSPAVLECIDSNDVALTITQRLGKQRAEKLNRRHLLDAVKASKSRKRPINEAREAVAKERSSFMNNLPNYIEF